MSIEIHATNPSLEAIWSEFLEYRQSGTDISNGDQLTDVLESMRAQHAAESGSINTRPLVIALGDGIRDVNSSHARTSDVLFVPGMSRHYDGSVRFARLGARMLGRRSTIEDQFAEAAKLRESGEGIVRLPESTIISVHPVTVDPFKIGVIETSFRITRDSAHSPVSLDQGIAREQAIVRPNTVFDAIMKQSQQQSTDFRAA